LRRTFRILTPLALLFATLWCGYLAAYFAWAQTAPPDTYNEVYERKYYIHGSLFLVFPVAAILSIYLLRPKKSRMSKESDERQQLDFFLSVTDVTLEDIEHRDKPDFEATHRGERIGIELTEGSPEELRRAQHIARTTGKTGYNVTGLQDNPKCSRRANSEVEADMSTPRMQNSEEAAVQWAERITQRISSKVAKVISGEIKSFPRNWLVIVDPSPDQGALETEFYRAVLMGAMGTDKSLRSTFDMIYIVSVESIIMINSTHTIGIDRRRKIDG